MSVVAQRKEKGRVQQPAAPSSLHSQADGYERKCEGGASAQGGHNPARVDAHGRTRRLSAQARGSGGVPQRRRHPRQSGGELAGAWQAGSRHMRRRKHLQAAQLQGHRFTKMIQCPSAAPPTSSTLRKSAPWPTVWQKCGRGCRGQAQGGSGVEHAGRKPQGCAHTHVPVRQRWQLDTRMLGCPSTPAR